VIDLSEDANIHFLEETFRHPDGSQRPEEIKLQNSSRSFSLTESIRDRGGDKL
jgi:hypothetical protein